MVATFGVSLAGHDVLIIVKEVFESGTDDTLDLEFAVELVHGALEVFTWQLFHVALTIGTEVLLLEPVFYAALAVDLAAVVAALFGVSGHVEADGTLETVSVDHEVAVESSLIHQNIL